MRSLEAMYVVEFGDIQSGAMRNGGIAVLETNRVFGGDSGYYYVGTFTVHDDEFQANLKIVKHDPAWTNAFGDDATEFKLRLVGRVRGDIIQGQMERLDKPGVKLPVKLTWKEALP